MVRYGPRNESLERLTGQTASSCNASQQLPRLDHTRETHYLLRYDNVTVVKSSDGC